MSFRVRLLPRDALRTSRPPGARVVWRTKRSYKDEEFVEAHSFSWPRARGGFEAFAERYPDSPANLDGLARLACVARGRHGSEPARLSGA